MKYTLVNRAKYCPIGVQSGVRLLPTTFIKLCKHHQSRASAGGGIGSTSSLLHSIACHSCPVAGYIMDDIDPVSVVADVEWIPFEEVLELQSRMQSLTETVDRIINVKRKNIRKGGFMRDSLIEIKSLLNRVTAILDSVLKSSDSEVSSMAVEMKIAETKTQQKETKLAPVIAQVEVEVEVKEKNGKKVASSDDLGGMTHRAYELASNMYADEVAGLSRVEISKKYALSSKYVGKLIRKYIKSNYSDATK